MLGKKAGIWVFIDGRLYSWLGVPGMLWGRIVTEVYRYAKKGQAARRFCTWAATVWGLGPCWTLRGTSNSMCGGY